MAEARNLKLGYNFAGVLLGTISLSWWGLKISVGSAGVVEFWLLKGVIFLPEHL